MAATLLHHPAWYHASGTRYPAKITAVHGDGSVDLKVDFDGTVMFRPAVMFVEGSFTSTMPYAREAPGDDLPDMTNIDDPVKHKLPEQPTSSDEEGA